MQQAPEKRVLPASAGVEAAEATPPVEGVERAVSVEANPAVLIEAVEHRGAGVDAVNEVREQIAQGGNALGTEKAGGPEEGGAVVILFPDAKERLGFQRQTTERQVVTLLHTRSAIANPGITIRLLQELPKAA